MEYSSGQEHKIYRTKVDKSGRIGLPAEVRATLGVAEGDSVLVVQEGRSFGIVTSQEALRQAQEYFMKLAPADVSMADDLIQEHREEAQRE